jgi:aminoglycoside phosphotransferase (APT) family kinase protein
VEHLVNLAVILNHIYYEVFGLFRLAVIIQQIWARYRAGQTTNPAFAGFGDAVNTLINRAEGKIA